MMNHRHHDTAHHKDHWQEMPSDFVEFLEREARLGAPLREATLARAAAALVDEPRQIVDLGSGVGADAAALATRFPNAEVQAVDVSPVLLELVAATAQAAGGNDRVRTHSVDLNGEWPEDLSRGVDLAWASLALHHVDDPAGALQRVHAALRPGGVLMLTEFDGGVRLSPSDLGTGIEGLADRMVPAFSPPQEYLDIEWRSLLERTGFTIVTRADEEFSADPSTVDGTKFLERKLRAARQRMEADLSNDELAKLDALIAALPEGASDVSLRSTRAVWVAQRAVEEPDAGAASLGEIEADVAVIGGGSAGLAAAIALARSRRTVVVVDAGQPRNAPADGAHNVLGQEGISPLELLAKGRGEAEAYGVVILQGHATAVSGGVDDFLVEVGGGAPRVHARRIILATGIEDELPEIPGVREGWGRSVLHCPFCHGWEVRDQRIAVLARNEMAIHQAMLFRQLTDRVTVFLHDAPEPTTEQWEQLGALDVTVVRRRITRLVMDGDQVRGVATEDGHVFDADAAVVAPRFNARTDLFESLGGEPEDFPFGTQIPTDPRGMTGIPGVWAAGNANTPMSMVAASAASGVAAGAAVHGDLCLADLERAVQANRSEAR